MSDILDQLRRVAYVMFKDGWQSKETAGLAFLEIVKLRAEITRLQKELETAREDALEEAAKVADGYVGMGWRGDELPAAIRALKDKEVAG